MTKVLERLFIAHRSRTKLKAVKGMNINPNKVNHQVLEGLMNMETYETSKSPATMSISTREVTPKNPFIASFHVFPGFGFSTFLDFTLLAIRFCYCTIYQTFSNRT